MYCDSTHDENVLTDSFGSPQSYYTQKTKSKFEQRAFHCDQVNFAESFGVARAFFCRSASFYFLTGVADEAAAFPRYART
jgi:hypothetical protein